MHYTRTTQESKALNFVKHPAVIISASGMAEAGRILHHLRNNIEDPRSTILITGFQAPHTLGRRLVDGNKRVKIFGEDYDVRARVEMLNGLSGHADRSELIAWAGNLKPQPRRTFLVHGEPEPAHSLAEGLRAQLGFPQVDVPDMGQTFSL
jgi:metallo-beta-lactamase family protein